MKALRRHFRVPMILLGLVNVGLWVTLAAPSLQMNNGMARSSPNCLPAVR